MSLFEHPTRAEQTVSRARRKSRPRESQAYCPSAPLALEPRALLSGGIAAGAPDDRADLAAVADRTRSFPWTERQNVPFPTPTGPAESLDVYTPKTPAPAGGYPVLVAIHGGGWRRFNKTSYGERIAIGFVDKGYVVVAPDYELSTPETPSWPVNFEDVQAAVTWVRAQASSLDINTSEIAAIGESAGANLAALLGTASPQSAGAPTSSAVDAVIAFSTPADLTSLYAESRYGGDAAAQFLGGSPSEVPTSYIEASPVDQVSSADPPMLLVHGRQDPLIPVSQSLEMARALSEAGVRNQLILVNGGHKLDFPAKYSNLIPQILEFLQTTWKD